MTFGSLFSGIGGMDLGLERAGMMCKWQVEIDPYCQRVLTKHWPHVPKYGDITKIKGEGLEPVDLIAGGFPCQDLSVAGRKAGIKEGTRSGLWAEFDRLIGELRPRFVLIENVPGLLANEPMRRVLGDLSSRGFDGQWESIPAAAVGANHLRDRVWIFASNTARFPRLYQSESTGGASRLFNNASTWWDANPWDETESKVCRMDDGIPARVVRTERLGNAVVPQVAEWIGRRILEAAGAAV